VVDYAAALRAAKALAINTQPSPQLEYLEEILGTWQGTQTAYVRGTKVTATLTSTNQRHGQRGLYTTTKVEIPGQPSIEGYQYLYDNGQTIGGFLPGTQPGVDFSFTGAWVSEGRMIRQTISVNLNGEEYSQDAQSTLVDKNTLNIFSSTSLGDRVLGTALKMDDPSPSPSPQPPSPTPGPAGGASTGGSAPQAQKSKKGGNKGKSSSAKKSGGG
jgi:hypothetical protein